MRGGVLAVLPGRLAIAVFSPRLDAHGNSVRGIAACRAISETFGLHLVSDRRPGGRPIRARYDLCRRRSGRRRPERDLERLGSAGERALVLELQGELEVSVEIAPGERRRLGTVPAGTVLGELAFLGSERRTADVTAATDARAFALSRAAFMRLGEQHPALRAALLERLLRFVARIAPDDRRGRAPRGLGPAPEAADRGCSSGVRPVD